ncbi:MAG: tRNA pseudouridine(38-40) synthase TruA [Planctomycetota bacterium]|jgi:tRNA pseudouridine38-40 synthase
MKTIKLTVEYDGNAYCGWQLQPNGPTIQEKLEAAVQALTGSFSRIHGSGRTDARVHAIGQVAHFQTDSSMAGQDFARALNAHLPKDISVRVSEEAEEGFHARFSARGKTYCYRIENAPTRPVLDRHRVWWITWPLCDELLEAGTTHILGTHDFTSFADAEREGEENVRTVRRAGWTRQGDDLRFTINGDGFLYKMVRCLVGTLIEVGRGKLPPEAVKEILEARDRRRAGPTAPPFGLHLMAVEY